MVIKIGKRGKVSTGQWENEEPSIEIEDTIEPGELEEKIQEVMSIVNEAYYGEVHKIKNPTPVEGVSQKLIFETAQEVLNIRTYEVNGLKLPSVTSIINFRSKVNEYVDITPEKLMQLASRGNIIHKQIEVYINTGEWLKPEAINACEKDLEFISGSDIVIDDTNFLGFEEKYPMEYLTTEETKVNLEHLYAGRQDLKCVYNGLVTVADFKTGSMSQERKLKTFAQLSAYANCPGNEDVQQMMIIHLNHKTKQGFSAPIIDTDIDKYFNMFLKKRKQLKRTLGI